MVSKVVRQSLEDELITDAIFPFPKATLLLAFTAVVEMRDIRVPWGEAWKLRGVARYLDTPPAED